MPGATDPFRAVPGARSTVGTGAAIALKPPILNLRQVEGFVFDQATDRRALGVFFVWVFQIAVKTALMIARLSWLRPD
jgi:hypothetical protein